LRVVGLTGGIATGKSTVAGILKAAGAMIIDADDIARKVVKKDTPAYKQVVGAFGPAILQPDDEIDRKKLGDIVFNDTSQKEILNAIIHPRVMKETERQLNRISEDQPDALVIVDVPLLFETNMQADFREVILVYAPEYLQLERLMARNAFSEAEAIARIRAQMPIEAKRKLADFVIDNSGNLDATRKEALKLYRQLKRKA
jgi:dephospho-CoA kinase